MEAARDPVHWQSLPCTTERNPGARLESHDEAVEHKVEGVFLNFRRASSPVVLTPSLRPGNRVFGFGPLPYRSYP